MIPRPLLNPYRESRALIVTSPLLEKLGAGYDGLDQAVESVAFGRQPVSH